MTKTPAGIMIVDDEEDFVEMLSLRLEAVGEQVIPAHSGRECLDILEEKDVDVIILDIKMPDMDGIQTLREIKRRFPSVEVIMMTGHGTVETALEGKEIGAYDYLLKPADFQELLEKVEGARKKKYGQAAT
jgi:DNA-binding NtrC family response regulator